MKMQTSMQTLKWNSIAVRHLQTNKESGHIKTCHMRHIFMPINQTIKNNLPHVTIC